MCRVSCSDGFDFIFYNSIRQQKNIKQVQKYAKLWSRLSSGWSQVSSIGRNVCLLLLGCLVNVGGKRVYGQEWHRDTLVFYQMENSHPWLWYLIHNRQDDWPNEKYYKQFQLYSTLAANCKNNFSICLDRLKELAIMAMSPAYMYFLDTVVGIS